MTRQNSPCWQKILLHAAGKIEQDYHVRLVVDGSILNEISMVIDESIAALGFPNPNVAKIAGEVAFWVRKLKPLSIASDSPNYYRFSNERAALLIGLAIANLYEDDQGQRRKVWLPSDILRDWITSLRYHSHSPYSSITSFELLLQGTPPATDVSSPRP